ncbi:MAG: DUF401 family protein [Desulfobacterales bacterium]|jgi:hypothetical protein
MASGVWRTSEARLLSDAPGVDPAPGVQPSVDKPALNTHLKTLALSIIVTLILVLSHSMEVSGRMNRLLDNFRGLVRRPSLNLIVFPALMGLLPMPGGAIFSAPMVKNLGHRHLVKGVQLS